MGTMRSYKTRLSALLRRAFRRRDGPGALIPDQRLCLLRGLHQSYPRSTRFRARFCETDPAKARRCLLTGCLNSYTDIRLDTLLD